MNKAQTQAQLMVENTDLIQSFSGKRSKKKKKKKKKKERKKERKKESKRKGRKGRRNVGRATNGRAKETR